MKPSHVTVALTAAVLALTACGTGDDSATPAPEATTPSGGDADADGDPGETDVEIPETPVGLQARWVMDQLAASIGPSAADATDRFGAPFLAEMPAEDAAATFNQLRTYGPFEVTGFQGTATQAQVALRTGTGDPMALELAVGDDGLLVGLFLRQLTEPPEIHSWDDVDAAYADLPGARVFAATVVDGACTSVHSYGDGSGDAPLGSVFKLYVLGAVQQAVLDGDLSWDDTVTVTAQTRVPTSVGTDQLPDGSELTVADAALQMISVSDNTATDLLMDAVGTEAVESAVSAMGHQRPAAMRPMLRTRELFQLGWTDPALRTAWSEADEAQRRTMLADLPSGPLDIDPATVVDPVHGYGIDWFASPADICAAHASLQEMAAADGGVVVRDLLAVNPGITIDSASWPYTAFKGGSAPGVLAGSWYLEDAAGTGYVLVIQFAGDDPAAVADLAYIFGVAGRAIDLFGAG